MAKLSFFAKITGIRKNDDQEEETGSRAEQKEDTTEKPLVQKNNHEHDDSAWAEQNYEGQLSVDVYQTENAVIIKSAVAGVNAQDLDISINNDMITIRGNRKQEEKIPLQNYIYQECYWGPFSRSIILPHEVNVQQSSAEFKKGILTIKLPKTHNAHTITLKVQEENDALHAQ